MRFPDEAEGAGVGVRADDGIGVTGVAGAVTECSDTDRGVGAGDSFLLKRDLNLTESDSTAGGVGVGGGGNGVAGVFGAGVCGVRGVGGPEPAMELVVRSS